VENVGLQTPFPCAGDSSEPAHEMARVPSLHVLLLLLLLLLLTSALTST
jgi:hypothetical protein